MLLNLGELHENVKDAVLQPDDKIVVLSTPTETWHGQTILSRYNPDGSLDHTFGEDGISIIKKFSDLSFFGKVFFDQASQPYPRY